MGWDTEDGGWIDNVPGTRSYELEGGYGYDPDPTPGGRQVTINNSDLVNEDQNKVENSGARAALRVDLSEKWVGTVGVTDPDAGQQGRLRPGPDPG